MVQGADRQELVKYFRLAHAAMNSEDGSIFLLDMLGGHAAESVVKLHRQNEISGGYCLLMHRLNCHFCPLHLYWPCKCGCATGLSYLWEQAQYDPIKRQLTCHISLKDPQTHQVCNVTVKYRRQLLRATFILPLTL